MKKLFAFLLTFAMLFSLSMPAMAAENDSKDVTATYSPTYTVTVDNSENGKVEANPARGVASTEITLTVTPDTGYELDALTVKAGTDPIQTTKGEDGKYTFNMPASNVTVTATFKEVVVPTYDIKIDENIENGTVNAPATATMGDTVTLTVTPNTGYQIGTVTVKDDLGNPVDFTETGVASGEYKFIMPASNVTVTASFEKLATTSAEISWGSMAFTYTDGENGAEDGAWTADTADKAGQVTVRNTGDTAFTATPSFVDKEDDYGTFSGSFDVASATLNAGEESTFTLSLSGAPTKAIPAGTKIGTVTVTITESIPAVSVNTLEGLQKALADGGNYQLSGPIDCAQTDLTTSKTVVLDMNGSTLSSAKEYDIKLTVKSGGNVTISGSTFQNNIKIEDGATVVINDGTYGKGDWYYPFYVYGSLIINGAPTINANSMGMHIEWKSGTIDLSNYTGSAITIHAGNAMPLSAITIPAGYSAYDYKGNLITSSNTVVGTNYYCTVKPTE